LSAELHDGAAGAERLRAAAEIPDLVVGISECRIVRSASKIFLTEGAGVIGRQLCCHRRRQSECDDEAEHCRSKHCDPPIPSEQCQRRILLVRISRRAKRTLTAGMI